jgi:hypothetical protein
LKSIGENWQTGITAEVYSPATSQWHATGTMGTFRSHHAAVLLNSGKVLVVGGTDGNGGVLASAELYEPATDTWSPAGSLATARSDHTATLLGSGKVLVAGCGPHRGHHRPARAGHPDGLHARAAGRHHPLQQRDIAVACGYDFVIGVSTQAHKDALLAEDESLNIIVTGCPR